MLLPPPSYAESAAAEVILPSQKEIDRRHKNIRSRMQAAKLAARNGREDWVRALATGFVR